MLRLLLLVAICSYLRWSAKATDVVWFEDALPGGATTTTFGGDSWNWVSSSPTPYTGSLAHKSANIGSVHFQRFDLPTATFGVGTGDSVYTYVYIDPAHPPAEIVLEWGDETGNLDHRAYWGNFNIAWWSTSPVHMGAIPSAGQWVRLEVPASTIGLEGHTLSEMAFILDQGSVTWDQAGKGTAAATNVDSVWFDDAIPSGATTVTFGSDSWNWVNSSPAPFSGSLAHKSGNDTGVHFHRFDGASTGFPIGAGDKVYTYVYLDPINTPTEIVLEWGDITGSWDHRAYWGGNNIAWWSTTPVNMGSLPAAGGWAKLEVPANLVGLEGKSLDHMAFILDRGVASWDKAGRSGSGTNDDGGNPITPPTGTNMAPTDIVDYTDLQLPQEDDHAVHILSPTLLELIRINSKPTHTSQVDSWNFVNSSTNFVAPLKTEFVVTANGSTLTVTNVGFKRRPLYARAPDGPRDLRIANYLYLQLSTAISLGQTVNVQNTSSPLLWPSNMQFTAVANALRFSPAIHVNQEGYMPGYTKWGMVGYYLGNLGEMPVLAGSAFQIVNFTNSSIAYTGTLTSRLDHGFTLSPAPYQKVLQADFTSFTTPGEYVLAVPGLGASLPFLINDGTAMDMTRTYALGLYHQRCGTNNALPFTRFTHRDCHTNLVHIAHPQSQYEYTWTLAPGESITAQSVMNPNANPVGPHTVIRSESDLLYPFMNTSDINLSGGYHDAGDYSKYTLGVAALAHYLLFSADASPAFRALDNLGLPESGDGKSDVLEMAKLQTDFLVKMQDADGGFYFLVYPQYGTYDTVLPESAGPQVVWPKNTSATAASVAALAEAASSPTFKLLYPQAASNYLSAALNGWTFLTNAFHNYGPDNSYQKLTFYGDWHTHTDEVAWAACELFLATSNQYFFQQMTNWFPDPNDPDTIKDSFRRCWESYGNAIRSYAFGARSGRVSSTMLDSTYWGKCTNQIILAANDRLNRASNNAYATSLSTNEKTFGDGHFTIFYFSGDAAFELAIGYLLNPDSRYIDGILGNMNYELGCNPVNVSFVEGLGWKRQRIIVDQYGRFDKRVMPPSGVPAGNLQGWIDTSGNKELYVDPDNTFEIEQMIYPSQSSTAAPFYPLYDRWIDGYNLNTEFITQNQARSLAAYGLLAAQTGLTNQSWTSASAQISVPTNGNFGNPVTVSVSVPGVPMDYTRVVWEAYGGNVGYGSGTNWTFTPSFNGSNWVEVEVQWPDGRRAFGTNNVFVDATNIVWVEDSIPSGATERGTWNWVSSAPTPYSGSLCHKSVSGTAVQYQGFTTEESTLTVSTGDKLYAYVYLDPGAAPTEVVLEFLIEPGSSTTAFTNARRARWGSDVISWYTSDPKTYYIGSLPATGGWARLEVSASALGLEGRPLFGLTFVIDTGGASWDHIGKSK